MNDLNLPHEQYMVISRQVSFEAQEAYNQGYTMSMDQIRDRIHDLCDSQRVLNEVQNSGQ